MSASRSRRPSAPKRWGNDYLESARGEDDVLPDEPVRDVEPDDTEFVALQSHFQHSMRFTAAARLFFAPKTRPCVLDPNRTKSFTVSAGVARLDANGIMGCSAWQEMHVTPYTTNRHTSAEWCHLWGAGLGGPTVSTNLVAASFACNSEMYEIEALLNGKTDLSAIVKVYVDPNNNRIAEYIKYIVYAGRARRKGANDWVRWIDGRGNGFNEQDGRALSQDLSRWLRQNRSPLQLQLAQFV